MSYELVTCPQCDNEAGVAMVRMNGVSVKHIEVHTRRDGSGQMCLGTGRRIEDAPTDLPTDLGPSVEAGGAGSGAVPEVPLHSEVPDVTADYLAGLSAEHGIDHESGSIPRCPRCIAAIVDQEIAWQMLNHAERDAQIARRSGS